MMRGEIDFLYEVPPEAARIHSSRELGQVFPFLRNYVYAVVFNSEAQAVSTTGKFDGH